MPASDETSRVSSPEVSGSWRTSGLMVLAFSPRVPRQWNQRRRGPRIASCKEPMHPDDVATVALLARRTRCNGSSSVALLRCHSSAPDVVLTAYAPPGPFRRGRVRGLSEDPRCSRRMRPGASCECRERSSTRAMCLAPIRTMPHCCGLATPCRSSAQLVRSPLLGADRARACARRELWRHEGRERPSRMLLKRGRSVDLAGGHCSLSRGTRARHGLRGRQWWSGVHERRRGPEDLLAGSQ